MKRRQVITALAGFTSAIVVSPLGNWCPSCKPITKLLAPNLPLTHMDDGSVDPEIDREQPILKEMLSNMDARDSDTMPSVVTQGEKNVVVSKLHNQRQRAIQKSIDFARDYDDDIYVTEADAPILQSLFLRLKNLQNTIGYGNFNIVSFDDALLNAKRFDAVGEFTSAEINFIERLYEADAREYGFFGQKVSQSLTQTYKAKDVVKIPRSGHFLLNDYSLEYYKKLRKEVGESIILTSGIRSNVKQLYLFIAKTIRVNNNLSRASRSLAPVGYSFHGIGDFDVGRIGWGAKNFTDDFSKTDEYKRMRDLGYVAIRYDDGNQLGVRYEPWHIKVV